MISMIRTKLLMKWAFALAIAISTSFSSSAQKTGHINIEELITKMPEFDKMKLKLDSLNIELQNQAKSLQDEFQKKYEDFQKNSPLWAPAITEIKTKELQDLQDRIQKFSGMAQESYSLEQQKLLEPVLKKAKDNISIVAKELGYTYVIDNSSNVLIVAPPADDLMAPVKKKLGIL